MAAATPNDETCHARSPERGCCRLVGFTTTACFLRVHPNPDGATSHLTKLPKDGSEVAGYLPEGRAQRGGRSRTNERLRKFHVNRGAEP